MRYLEFCYNSLGRGPLTLWEDASVVERLRCRTGSINSCGELVNAIQPGVWTGRERPVETDEKAMYIIEGNGWKWRLWKPNGEWSHYLVHPDGHLPGSDGCLAIQDTDALGFKEMLHETMHIQAIVPVFIYKILA